jgi:hypothetical protein
LDEEDTRDRLRYRDDDISFNYALFFLILIFSTLSIPTFRLHIYPVGILINTLYSYCSFSCLRSIPTDFFSVYLHNTYFFLQLSQTHTVSHSNYLHLQFIRKNPPSPLAGMGGRLVDPGVGLDEGFFYSPFTPPSPLSKNLCGLTLLSSCYIMRIDSWERERGGVYPGLQNCPIYTRTSQEIRFFISLVHLIVGCINTCILSRWSLSVYEGY